MTRESIAGTSLRLGDPSLQQILNQTHGRIVAAVERAAEEGPEDLGGGRLCDAVAILAAADRLGHHDLVRRVLYEYGTLQRLSGEFRLGGRAPESTGCAIWSLVDHARLTADTDFLKAVYRPVRRGLQWMRRKRAPDGSERHAGLMPHFRGRETSDEGAGRYPVAFWCLAGGQEAARAAAVLDHKSHVHDAESYFQEFKRALFRSLRQTALHRGGPGLPLDPDGENDARSAANLLALVPGDILPPGQEHMVATLEALARVEGHLSPLHRMALAQHLLHRGDGSLWSLIDRLVELWHDPQNGEDGEKATDEVTEVHASVRTGVSAGIATGITEASHLAWLLRNILVTDQHDLMLIAPGYALSPVKEWNVEVEQAPTRFGPVSFRLERTGSQVSIEWGPLVRPAPQHLVLPLPARAARLEPPRATFTATRTALRLPPEGGRFKIDLLA
jgi:hypothetical protein